MNQSLALKVISEAYPWIWRIISPLLSSASKTLRACISHNAIHLAISGFPYLFNALSVLTPTSTVYNTSLPYSKYLKPGPSSENNPDNIIRVQKHIGSVFISDLLVKSEEKREIFIQGLGLFTLFNTQMRPYLHTM